eukprot:160219-Pyramimonas_sp.AAC.1
MEEEEAKEEERRAGILSGCGPRGSPNDTASTKHLPWRFSEKRHGAPSGKPCHRLQEGKKPG